MSANLCELHEQGDTHKFLLKKCDNPLILAPYLEIQKGIIANELNTHSESIHVFDENTVHKPSCSYFNSNFLTKEPMQVAFDSSNGHLTSLALHQKGICIILNQNILNEENISPSTVDFLRHIFDNESIEKVSERMWLLILFLQSRYNIVVDDDEDQEIKNCSNISQNLLYCSLMDTSTYIGTPKFLTKDLWVYSHLKSGFFRIISVKT